MPTLLTGGNGWEPSYILRRLLRRGEMVVSYDLLLEIETVLLRDKSRKKLTINDVLSYVEMMQTYAEVAGLPRRIIVPVPFLSPRLSSRWVAIRPASAQRRAVSGLTPSRRAACPMV